MNQVQDYSQEPPVDHHELMARLRFSLDEPGLPQAGSPEAQRERYADRLRYAESNYLRVSSRLVPGVAEAVATASARLLLPEEPIAFLRPTNDLNAAADSCEGQGYIVLNSGLVQLMSPEELVAVIGHEIGHSSLGHSFEQPEEGPALALARERQRAHEVSADRVSVVAAGDPRHATRAQLKLAAGLTLPHLTPDLDAFVGHLEGSALKGEDPWALMETHPSLVFRAWAIRRFAESDLHCSLQGREGGEPMEQIELEIADRFAGEGGCSFRVTSDHLHEALAWLGVLIMCDDGAVSDIEQSALVEFLGIIWAEDAVAYTRRHGLKEVERQARISLEPLRFSTSATRRRLSTAIDSMAARSDSTEAVQRVRQIVTEMLRCSFAGPRALIR